MRRGRGFMASGGALPGWGRLMGHGLGCARLVSWGGTLTHAGCCFMVVVVDRALAGAGLYSFRTGRVLQALRLG